ncbi:hypothetical protein AB0H36_43290 [Kribbella sp. NPDC050820]|uniref:hypothetical protein n=1 Tax=Kribbella sp. NPDC050820 TaxID=3155408 RepID=UPI0033DA5048
MRTVGAVTSYAKPDLAAMQTVGTSLAEELNSGDSRGQSVEELERLALEGDPLRLYSALHVLHAIRRATTDGPDHFGNDAMVEFFGGIVSTLNEVDVLPKLDQLFDPYLVWTIDSRLREHAAQEWKQHQLSVLTRDKQADSSLRRAQHQIEFENLFDRMAGYEQHVRRIVSAVLDPLDGPSRDALGFRLSDSIRFADLQAQFGQSRFEGAQAEMERLYPSAPGKAAGGDAFLQWAGGNMAILALTGGAQLQLEEGELFAEQLEISEEEFSRLVDAMSTRVGSQASVGRLADTNSLRTRPILTLSTGEWLWAAPVDFLHCVLQWAAQVCSSDESMLRAFDKTRQRTAETMPHALLARIFGAGSVHANPTYPSGSSRPDIDVLADLPSLALVVESKGGRFTDPARRGAPARVEKHAKDMVMKAREQNIRTVEFLSGTRAGLKTDKGRALQTHDFVGILPVIVTLDRIDPFSTNLSRTETFGRDPDASWVVALSDLLLVADILRSPSEFLAYCLTRAEISELGCPLIMVESDALGEWCKRRLKPSLLTPETVSMVSETSIEMNNYFTALARPEMGLVIPPIPQSGVPRKVIEALDELLSVDSPWWKEHTSAVFQVPPSQWKAIRRQLRTNPGSEAGTRHSRKKARRAADGLRIGDHTTIRVSWDGQPADSTADTLWLSGPPD